MHDTPMHPYAIYMYTACTLKIWNCVMALLKRNIEKIKIYLTSLRHSKEYNTNSVNIYIYRRFGLLHIKCFKSEGNLQLTIADVKGVCT